MAHSHPRGSSSTGEKNDPPAPPPEAKTPTPAPAGPLAIVSANRSAIIMWGLRHIGELPAAIPLLKDAADYGGLEETVDDGIALLNWFKPIAHDFPERAAVVTLSADEVNDSEAKILGLFNGDGSKLKRWLDALDRITKLIDLIRGVAA